jgi:glycosyltransferase involved in cell wall biosynthesis
MRAAPDVSVLVPVRDEAAAIRETVAAMRAQRLDGALELLLVDGGSRDGTREILAELARADPRVRVLENPHGGIPQALNVGLRAARGAYVARMDAHTLYPPDYLATGMRWLAEGAADWVAGPQLPHGVDRWSTRIAHALRSPLGVGGAAFRRPAATAFEADAGFTGLWRRETLLQLGGWNERWAVNEDGELAARVRASGGRIVCVPEMAARWIPRRSLRGLVRQYWRYGRYRALTAREHPASMRRSHLLPAAVTVAALGAAVPMPATRVFRRVMAAYAGALCIEAARTARGGVPLRDAAALPLVFAAMHLPWGAGYLAGWLRPPSG